MLRPNGRVMRSRVTAPVGRSPRDRRTPYGISTTILKNRIAAFSAAVAASTAFQSPSTMSTAQLRGYFSVLRIKSPPYLAVLRQICYTSCHEIL